MHFTAPWWLLALAPWLGLAIYLLLGRSPRVEVPFVELWQDPDLPRPRRARSLHPPPLPIALLLIALLLSIFAAADTSVATSSSGPPLTLIVDRGVTMSAQNSAANRWMSALSQVRSWIIQFLPPTTPVRLVQVPGAGETASDLSDWYTQVPQPTALDTAQAMRQAAIDALRETQQPVIVVTRRKTGIDDPRLIEIAPPMKRLQNIGLVRIGARTTPTPAAMVTVRNDSDQWHARLRVVSAGAGTIEQMIDLAMRGSETNAFVDLHGDPGETICFELISDDDIPVDNRAWLVRQWPKIEAMSALPEALGRMIDVYSKHRPPSGGSGRVVVTADVNQLPSAPAAIMAATGEGASLSQQPTAIDHPLARDVRDWPKDAVVASTPPVGDGWTPIVSGGDRVLVAARQRPHRQVWVAFDSATFVARPDFVVFWTNVFDWLAGDASAGEEYRCEVVRSLGEGWTRDDLACGPKLTDDPATGIYRRGSGTLAAMCAMDVGIPGDQPSADWQPKLRSLPVASGGQTRLSPLLLVLATALLALSVATWTRRVGSRPRQVNVVSTTVA
jgi:hypothetical protein